MNEKRKHAKYGRFWIPALWTCGILVLSLAQFGEGLWGLDGLSLKNPGVPWALEPTPHLHKESRGSTHPQVLIAPPLSPQLLTLTHSPGLMAPAFGMMVSSAQPLPEISPGLSQGPPLRQVGAPFLLVGSSISHVAVPKGDDPVIALLTSIHGEDPMAVRMQALTVVQKLQGSPLSPVISEEISSAVVTQAQLYLGNGEAEKAFQLCSAVLWLAPGSLALNETLAVSAESAGEMEEAFFAYERAVALAPQEERLQLRLDQIRQGLGFSQIGREGEEEEILGRPKEPSPHSVWGYAELSYAWDDNLGLGTDSSVPDPNSPGDTIEPDLRRDRFADLYVNLSHNYRAEGSPWGWFNRFRLSIARFDQYEEEHTFLFRPATGLGYRDRVSDLRIFVFWEPFYLADNLYQIERGLELSAYRDLKGPHSLNLFYSYSIKHRFGSSGSDFRSHRGQRHVITLSHVYRSQERSRFLHRVRYSWSESPKVGRNHSQHAKWSLLLRYYKQPIEKLEYYFGVRLYNDRYCTYDSTYSDRRSKECGIGSEAGVTIDLGKGISFLSHLTHRYNHSNIPTDTYRQLNFDLGLGWSF